MSGGRKRGSIGEQSGIPRFVPVRTFTEERLRFSMEWIRHHDRYPESP